MKTDHPKRMFISGLAIIMLGIGIILIFFTNPQYLAGENFYYSIAGIFCIGIAFILIFYALISVPPADFRQMTDGMGKEGPKF